MSKSDGFTLIEILVAGAILVVVLLGVATMSLTAHGQLHRSGEETTAAILGQQRIEWLRNQGYDSSDLGAGSTTESLGGTYAGYSRTTAVQADTPRAGVKQVTVTTITPAGLRFDAWVLVAE